jgi:hypothetical protein
VEFGIKINMRWVGRRSLKAGIAEFAEQWNALQTFANADPRREFRCRYLWELMLQVRGCQPDGTLANELCASAMTWAPAVEAPRSINGCRCTGSQTLNVLVISVTHLCLDLLPSGIFRRHLAGGCSFVLGWPLCHLYI